MIKRIVILLTMLVSAISFFVYLGFTKHTESDNYVPDHKSSFVSKSVPSGSKSKYDMNLTMNEKGIFHLQSTVTVTNISEDSWTAIVFYFVPNMFTKKSPSQLNQPSDIHFNKVAINGESANFKLQKDTLTVPLKKALAKNKEIKVMFDYHFTLPENGLRFTKSQQNYYLAQFYPMVATYRNHEWNKEPYRFRGETYHTAFSDFKVAYDLPKEYTMVSTSENDTFPSKNKGIFEVKQVKEVFIALLKKPFIFEQKEENVTIRVIGLEQNDQLYKKIRKEAASAFTFFQKTIGPYPFKQLDIIIDQPGMEYPGVVTAGNIYNSTVSDESLHRLVVHEIAHQWFYGMISNDPYHEAWLDEGFTEFATSLYLFSKSKDDIPYKTMYKQFENLTPLPVNLPLDQYGHNSSSYVYGKSSVMLWKLVEHRGGKKAAGKFLMNYYKEYNYKEVDTDEFIRFAKYYLHFKNNKAFNNWLDFQ